MAHIRVEHGENKDKGTQITQQDRYGWRNDQSRDFLVCICKYVVMVCP